MEFEEFEHHKKKTCLMNFKFSCPITASEIENDQCQLCQKKIIDCREMSDGEIEDLAREKGSFCGVFKPKPWNSSGTITTFSKWQIAVVWVFLLGWNYTMAQELSEVDSLVLNTQIDSNSSVIKFSGSIKNKNGESIPFAKIICSHKNVVLGMAKSDFEGNYNLEIDGKQLTDSLIIECKVIGFEPEVKIIKAFDGDTLVNFQMTNPMVLGVVGIFYDEKRVRNPSDPYDFGKTVIPREDIRW